MLDERRESDCDKWYDRAFVVWYFFSRALRCASADAGDVILDRLGASGPGSALERAVAACVQLDWNRRIDDETVNSLVDAQLPSGGWPLAPVYKGGGARWGSEELTTAFCVEALSRWLTEQDR